MQLEGSTLVSEQVFSRLAEEAQRRNCPVDQLVDQLLSSNTEIERALRESETRYHGLVESQIDLVCMYTPDLELTFVNDAYCAFWGKTREELLGKSFVPLVDADQQEAIYRRRDECLLEPKARVAEVRKTDDKGHVRWVQWVDFGLTNDTGKVVQIQAVGRDVTRLKQVEAELRAREEHYRVIFERSPLPMWVYDLETLGFRDVNDAALDHYGYTREEFLRLNVLAIQDPTHVERLHALLAQPDLGSVQGLEWRHRKKDGSSFDVEIVSHEFVFEGRRTRLVIARDLTERKQLEDQRVYTRALELALAKDREIIELKERFVSVVSHEFRTPLTVISTLTNLLRQYSHKLTPETQKSNLDKIAHQIKRMTRLLEDVLAISRGNAHRIAFQPAALDIHALCSEIVETARAADQEQHSFILDNALPPATTIMADQRLVEHIVTNLLSNAAKYSATGRPIKLQLAEQDSTLTLTVQDEGIGIPPEYLPHLFEPFHRANNVGTTAGTGLGLAIVKQSVEAHGGSIACESKLGEGTTFKVRLPHR